MPVNQCDPCLNGDTWHARRFDEGEVFEICMRQFWADHELCERGDCDCHCRD